MHIIIEASIAGTLGHLGKIIHQTRNTNTSSKCSSRPGGCNTQPSKASSNSGAGISANIGSASSNIPQPELAGIPRKKGSSSRIIRRENTKGSPGNQIRTTLCCGGSSFGSGSSTGSSTKTLRSRNSSTSNIGNIAYEARKFTSAATAKNAAQGNRGGTRNAAQGATKVTWL
jgi:hypothetical protein